MLLGFSKGLNLLPNDDPLENPSNTPSSVPSAHPVTNPSSQPPICAPNAVESSCIPSDLLPCLALRAALSLVAANAPDEQFVQMRGPLMVGFGVVLAASVGNVFFPAMPLLYNISLYGGLLVFGGFTLLDTQFVTSHLAKFGAIEVSREEFQRLLDLTRVRRRCNFFGLAETTSASGVLQLVSQTSNTGCSTA